MNRCEVTVDVVVNKKALRAIAVIIDALNDVSEDFAYRDDVARALRAARYLMKNVRLDCSDSGAKLFQ